MRRIHIVEIASAAIFAFSMIVVSGASAAPLWDQCTTVARVLEFSESNCITKASHGTWGWEEIIEKEPVDTLTTLVNFSSGGLTIDCVGLGDGFVGPRVESEVTELLNAAGKAITEAEPLECTKTAGSNLECEAPVLISPDNLPWLSSLQTAETLLLEPHAGGGNPGFLVKCKSTENLCEKENSLALVVNLLAELEVDIILNPKELLKCTNPLASSGTIEGETDILLVNGNALRAME